MSYRSDRGVTVLRMDEGLFISLLTSISFNQVYVAGNNVYFDKANDIPFRLGIIYRQ